MALFIRSRVKDLTFLESTEFKKINSNIISRFPIKSLQTNVQRILDSYLDKDRNQINLLVNDLIEFLGKLSPEEQKALEEIILKNLLIISDEKISSDTLTKFADGFELMIKYWPEISEML